VRADEVREALVGEREVDDDAVAADPPPALGDVPERRSTRSSTR